MQPKLPNLQESEGIVKIVAFNVVFVFDVYDKYY